jgi:hypothetical protein
VKTASRFTRLAYGVALGTTCLLLLSAAGCRGGDSPGEAPGQDEDHVGHVIPAHKPKSFPEAVHRLRELNDQFARGAGQARPAVTGDPSLNIALDIANWLPEIAAESDMREKPWDEVNGSSAALVADYRAILSGASADDGGKSVRAAGAAISDLEKILAAADPRWFAAPERRREEPDPGPSVSGAPTP